MQQKKNEIEEESVQRGESNKYDISQLVRHTQSYQYNNAATQQGRDIE